MGELSIDNGVTTYQLSYPSRVAVAEMPATANYGFLDGTIAVDKRAGKPVSFRRFQIEWDDADQALLQNIVSALALMKDGETAHTLTTTSGESVQVIVDPETPHMNVERYAKPDSEIAYLVRLSLLEEF